jgi:hypothetical protein
MPPTQKPEMITMYLVCLCFYVSLIMMIVTYYSHKQIFDSNKNITVMYIGIFLLIAFIAGFSIIGPTIFDKSQQRNSRSGEYGDSQSGQNNDYDN